MAKTSRFSTGFLVGFGAGFVSRDLLQPENSMTRPLIKTFLKTGVTVLEKGRESLAHMFETIEDLLAEVRSEKKTKDVKVKVEVETENGKPLKTGPTHVKVSSVSKSS